MSHTTIPAVNPRASPREIIPADAGLPTATASLPTTANIIENSHHPPLDHSHRSHSILSASSSKRWIHCPPSAVLNDRFPDKTSVYAAEGTAMHERCEWKLRTALGEDMDEPHSEYDTEETEQVTDVYAEFCLKTIEDMRASGIEPLILIEERLDFSHIAPNGFGTGDLVLVGAEAVSCGDGDKDRAVRGLIHVIDFKGGRGVRVEAEMNSQMLLYAAAALNTYGFLVDPEIIRMSIVQPRLDNISTFEMTVEELNAWAESIKPIARMAFEGKGEQHTGDWCIFCKAKAVCRACAEEALALAREEFLDLDSDLLQSPIAPSVADEGKATAPDTSTNTTVGVTAKEAEKSDTPANKTIPPTPPTPTIPSFKSPQLIPIDELASLLPSLTRIGSWIEAVFAFLSAEAITHGTHIPGYKVVEGRSKRVFTDSAAAASAAEAAGVTNLYKTELRSLSEIEKLMGRKRFAEVLGDYVVKPPGKLSLVPEDDPRPAVNNATAADEFEVLEEER